MASPTTNRAGYFPLNSLDCDFVVHVALNRGERRLKRMVSDKIGKPTIYVFPIGVCAAIRGASNKINIRNIDIIHAMSSSGLW
jgi:hypothetical protein